MIAWPRRHEAGINGRRNTSHPDPAVLGGFQKTVIQLALTTR